MTDEIIRLYENAGIKPIAEYCKHQCNNEFDDDACIGCKHIEKVEYPPFTAEKVLKVLVFFLNRGVRLDFSVEEHTEISVENFKECIAHIVVRYWQVLSEEEKQQVKGILE